jgi:hypothetical protein
MLPKTPNCVAGILDKNKENTKTGMEIPSQKQREQQRQKSKESVIIPKTVTEAILDTAEKTHGHFTCERSERKPRELRCRVKQPIHKVTCT